MPILMAALPNAEHGKVWLTPTAQVPCSNAANIGECKTWRERTNYAQRGGHPAEHRCRPLFNAAMFG